MRMRHVGLAVGGPEREVQRRYREQKRTGGERSDHDIFARGT